MKTQHIHFFKLAAAMVLAFGLLASCIMPFGISSDKSVVTIQTGLLPANARGAMPGTIDSILIQITAPDMEPIVRTVTSGSVEIEVPAGEMRLFSVMAHDNEYNRYTHYGASFVSLAGGQSTSVSVEMEPLQNDMYAPMGTYYTQIFCPQGISFPQAVAAAAIAAPPGWESHLATYEAESQSLFGGDIILEDYSQSWIGFTLVSVFGESVVLAQLDGETWSGFNYFDYDYFVRDVNASHFGISMRGDFKGTPNIINYTWETQAADTKLNYYLIEFIDLNAGAEP